MIYHWQQSTRYKTSLIQYIPIWEKICVWYVWLSSTIMRQQYSLVDIAGSIQDDAPYKDRSWQRFLYHFVFLWEVKSSERTATRGNLQRRWIKVKNSGRERKGKNGSENTTDFRSDIHRVAWALDPAKEINAGLVVELYRVGVTIDRKGGSDALRRERVV